MTTMKEAIVDAGPTVTIHDSPTPTPNADQVLIKVVVSGTNPKDWKVPEWWGKAGNQGDDIAGTVVSVGDNVTEFKPGDRVAAFHQMLEPGGSYAEYGIAWQHTTFHIPKETSFEEAATIPLAAMTSAAALFLRLGLPEPWRPASSPLPLIIYGGASAIGAYAIQLAQKANIHPIIAVAGRGIPFVEGLISREKGDTIVDYRGGDEAVIAGIQEAGRASGKPLLHAFDAVSEGSSYINLSRVLADGGQIALVLPGREYPGIKDSVEKKVTSVGCVHQDDQDFGFVYFRYLGKGLRDGWFRAHPHEVVSGGLGGLETALRNLKEGKASAVKYVVRV